MDHTDQSNNYDHHHHDGYAEGMNMMVAAAMEAPEMHNDHEEVHQAGAEAEAPLDIDVPFLPPALPNEEETNINVNIEGGDEAQHQQDEPAKSKRHNRAKSRPHVVPRHLVDNEGNEADKLHTNQLLLQTSKRLDDAISELMEYSDILSDHSSENKPKREKSIKNIREYIVPLLHICARSMQDTGLTFAPFGGTLSMHKRNEVQKRKEIVDRTKLDQQSPQLQMIDDFIQHSVVIIPENLRNLARKSTSATTASTSINDLIVERDAYETIKILRPRNGTIYTKSEALATAKLYKKKSKDRGLAMRAMIETGLTPTSVKTIQRLIQADEEGHPIVDEEWKSGGRPKKYEHAADEAKQVIGGILRRNYNEPDTSDLITVSLKKRVAGLPTSAEISPDGTIVAPNGEVGKKRKATSSTKKGGKKKNVAAVAKRFKPAPDGMLQNNPASQSSFTFGQVQKATNNAQAAAATMLTTEQLNAKPPAKKKAAAVAKGGSLVVSKPALTNYQKKKAQAMKNPEVMNFPLPEPKDGKNYQKSEAVVLARQYQKGECVGCILYHFNYTLDIHQTRFFYSIFR